MVRLFREEEIMSIARITEISSTSEKSFEDAIQSAVTRATQTLRNVRGAWVKEQQIKIEDGKIVEYQVNLMITFVLEDDDQTDVA
jgi:flavin-binding protein dodecin